MKKTENNLSNLIASDMTEMAKKHVQEKLNLIIDNVLFADDERYEDFWAVYRNDAKEFVENFLKFEVNVISECNEKEDK